MFDGMPNLKQHPLYEVRDEDMTTDERIALSYKRAKLVLETHNLSINDILECTPKFWRLHCDPVLPLDMACYTIIAAHATLAVGTIAKHAQGRSDLTELLERLRLLDIVGLYLLTERGHGTDAFNVETTASANGNGYLLNTPREEAAKWVPATTPLFNIAKVAVVFARLIRDGRDCGVRAFLVPICDTKEMCPGVSCIRLSPRSGTSPLDFAMTFFSNVQLPHSALLGPEDVTYPDPLIGWWNEVSRIPIGSAAITAVGVQTLKHVAYVGGSYSLVRTVWGKGTEPVPIISFRTQQRVMLEAMAAAFVLDSWFPRIAPMSSDQDLHPSVRHAMAVILKATVLKVAMPCIREVVTHCGAQGTFEHNLVIKMETDLRGGQIAEGETLTLCIRLFNELLRARYPIPSPKHTNNSLWENAVKAFDDARQLLSDLPGENRLDEANRFLSPLAEPAIVAVGFAHAYSAGVEANLPPSVLQLFECLVHRLREPLSDIWTTREDKAITAVLPDFREHLSKLNVAEFVKAPIVSDTAWKDYLQTRKVITGSARVENVIPIVAKAKL